MLCWNEACILSKTATQFVINHGAYSLSLKREVNKDVINLYKLSLNGFLFKEMVNLLYR